jgi:ribonucleoside-diphosphate reductase alpha chain
MDGMSAAPVQAASAPTVQGLPEPEIVGQVCMLRPGDAGYEECEACQ